MVSRHFRGSSVTTRILTEAYRIARQKNIKFAFSHCRPQLAPLYQKMGWRPYTKIFEDEDAGLQVPLVLILEDEKHLLCVNSMLLPEARNWSNDQMTARWFEDSFSLSD